jgi:hypothetical protein
VVFLVAGVLPLPQVRAARHAEGGTVGELPRLAVV